MGVTRSTPSAGPTETGAQALGLNVAIQEQRQVRALRLRNQERNLARNQARSQGRSLGRSQERSQERNPERNPERNQERNPVRNQKRSQEKERNQTKVEQEQRILLNVLDAKQLNFIGQITINFKV